MNSTVRVLALALLGLFLTFGLNAADWDWGGSLDNATTLYVTTGSSSSTPDVVQKDKLALWVQAQFGPALALTAQGSYLLSYDTTSSPTLRPYLFDVDYLKAEWTIRPNLHGAAGRFLVADFTRLVLNHTLDGLQLRYDLPFLSLTGSVGTPALLLKPVSRIILSGPDSADLLDESAYFAAPRLVQSVSAVFPQLFARQDLSVALLAQEDLRPSDQVIPVGYENQTYTDRAGGKLHSFFLGAGLNGPIVPSLYYDSFLYFETGSALSYVEDSASGTGKSWQNKPIVAFFGGIGVRYYVEKFLNSRAELRGIFSSGDADNETFLEGSTAGSSTLFVPISRETIGLAFDPQLGNLLLLEASYSVKPTESLQAVLKTQAFLRPSTGAISETGLATSSASRYLGTQFEGIVNFRPWSDLGMVLTLGTFLPSPAAFPGGKPKLAGRFELSLGF